MTAERALVADLRVALRRRADPARAGPMRAYLKTEEPMLGVNAPDQSAVYREVFRAHPLASFAGWRDTVLALWRRAAYREERYAAISLALDRRYRELATRMDALPIFEEIVDGAWWDLVDGVAVHGLGPLLRAHPAQMRRVLLRWARSDDMWQRRSAIIAQSALKEDADAALLHACIAPNLARTEFWIRKAIGWALRERAKTAPDEVRRYVRDHDAVLSPLSKREALKHLGAATVKIARRRSA